MRQVRKAKKRDGESVTEEERECEADDEDAK